MQTHKHGDLKVQGEFDHISVNIGRATGVAHVQVSLTVLNASERPIPFTFNTTQRFEIEVIDQEGQIVALWSEGQVFGDAVSTHSLEPHHSWRFEGKVEAPMSGTVRMYLTADLRPGVQAPISVNAIE